ncbi:MAG: hypothetical protein KDA61_11705 [Planctomycetales bacterium]|nr:hypothetical protein [Planctomycetales bacterium]
MTSTSSVASQAAIVVKLSSAEGGADQANLRAALLRRLVEDRLPATWVARDASQCSLLHQAINRCPGSDAGLEIASPNARAASEPLSDLQWAQAARQSAQLRSAGLNDAVVVVSHVDLLAGRENGLTQLGVRAVVVEAARQESVRALTPGLWAFAVAEKIPSPRFFLGGMGAKTRRVLLQHQGDVATLIIDLDQIPGPESRAWKQLQRSLDAIAWSVSNGEVVVATVGHIANAREGRLVGQPQRSILKAA